MPTAPVTEADMRDDLTTCEARAAFGPLSDRAVARYLRSGHVVRDPATGRLSLTERGRHLAGCLAPPGSPPSTPDVGTPARD